MGERRGEEALYSLSPSTGTKAMSKVRLRAPRWAIHTSAQMTMMVIETTGRSVTRPPKTVRAERTVDACSRTQSTHCTPTAAAR